jgi:uncharacterized membrane protein
MVDTRYDGDGTRFLIRPNASLSWHDAKAVFAATCTASAAIAAALCRLGAWIVLPIALIEMAVLGAALYCCACRAAYRELITLREAEVKVAKGRRRVDERWSGQRHWVQVRLVAPRHEWYASRLWLVSHGRGVELGSCLNEDERRDLADRLRSALRT